MKYLITGAICLLAAVILLLAIRHSRQSTALSATASSHVAESHLPETTPLTKPQAPHRQAGDSGLKIYATRLFRQLAVSTGMHANWSVQSPWQYWFTKCDLGLSGPTCTKTPEGVELAAICAEYEAAKRPNSPSFLSRRHAKLAVPKNERLAFFLGLETPHQTTHKPPSKADAIELDSVLFNEQAACSIQRLNLSQSGSLTERLANAQRAHQDQTLPEMDYGSVIIKTIWECAFKGNASITRAISVAKEGLVDNSKVIDPGNNSLFALGSWGPDYSTTINTAYDEKACTVALSDGSLPKSCFTMVDLATDKDSLRKQIAGAQVANPAVLGNLPDYAVLVGVNMMELEKQFPNWLWASFWWTKEINQDFKGLPQWQHFSACAISTPRSVRPRDNFPVEFDSSVCFNPYLEGVRSTNGIVSNCLSCHQFAAYRPPTQHAATTTPDKNDPCSNEMPTTQISDGSCLGLPNEQGVVGVPIKCAQSPACYWKKSLATRFLWSLADMQ